MSNCQNINNTCMNSASCEQWYGWTMIAILATIILGTYLISYLLYIKRNRYPIAERSYRLSISMCVCFAMIIGIYPYVQIANYFQYNISSIPKFIYMTGLFGIYLSYMGRMIRIRAALSQQITKVLEGQEDTKKWARISVWILSRESEMVIIVFFISCLLSSFVFFKNDIYFLPYENQNSQDGNSSPESQNSYEGFGDFPTAYIFNFSIGIFLYFRYYVRMIPHHYGFTQETKLNLISQWAKSIFTFFFNFVELEWCNNKSTYNILATFTQYFLMILISVIPSLLRQRFKADRPPFPDLSRFKEFLEHDDRQNFKACNFAFISYLKIKDEIEQKKKINSQTYRQNLNICEFYFQMKMASLFKSPQEEIQLKSFSSIQQKDKDNQDSSFDQSEINHQLRYNPSESTVNKQYFEELLKIADTYITDPRHQQYKLDLPQKIEKMQFSFALKLMENNFLILKNNLFKQWRISNGIVRLIYSKIFLKKDLYTHSLGRRWEITSNLKKSFKQI